MKKVFFLVLILNAAGVKAQSNVNTLLIKYCGEKNNISQSVTIEGVTAIGYHRSGYLKIEQSVENETLKAQLAKLTEKVGFNSRCMNFLGASSLLSMDNANAKDKELLARVYFDFDRYSLTPKSMDILKTLAIKLNNNSIPIEIIGHADSVGSRDYNSNLGMQRAHSVINYLVEQGVTNSELEVYSLGEDSPLESGDNIEYYKKNRRVDIY